MTLQTTIRCTALRAVEHLLSRETRVASLVFLTSASAVLSLFGGPAEFGMVGTVGAVLLIFLALGWFLHFYTRLLRAERIAGFIRPAQAIIFALPVAIAFFLCAANFKNWFGPDSVRSREYSTDVGAFENISLADASVIELNTDSIVSVRFSESSRQVFMERGEARFTVSRRDARPFEVHAGGISIKVVGTVFSVRIFEPDHVEVLVEEGRVTLAESFQNEAAKFITTLDPGESAVVRGSKVSSRAVDPSEIRVRLAWRDGLLRFQGEQLPQVVAEMNRYNRRKIVIDDPALAEMRLGGAFNARDPAAFVRGLDSLGIRSEVTSDVYGNETFHLRPGRIGGQ